MNNAWIQALRIVDGSVNEFVDANGDANGDNYQLKIDVLRSIATRSLAGYLRYLPTKTRIAIAIRLPV